VKDPSTGKEQAGLVPGSLNLDSTLPIEPKIAVRFRLGKQKGQSAIKEQRAKAGDYSFEGAPPWTKTNP